MSRLPRLVDPQALWLSGLRAGLRRIAARREALLVAPDTAGTDFIQRGAQRLGVSTEQIIRPVAAHVNSMSSDGQLAEEADELLVLGLRPRGKWHSLLQHRLKSGRRGVVLIDLEDLQPTIVRQELLDLGARLWRPEPSLQVPFDSETRRFRSTRSAEKNNETRLPSVNCTLHPLPCAEEWSFLIH
ncbi:MAG: hypothetical protein JWM11_6292, partial [Planctomycetaceae bacterium]|nr:hypothetical protein [Planctomycetaceae bacterium]